MQINTGIILFLMFLVAIGAIENFHDIAGDKKRELIEYKNMKRMIGVGNIISVEDKLYKCQVWEEKEKKDW